MHDDDDQPTERRHDWRQGLSETQADAFYARNVDSSTKAAREDNDAAACLRCLWWATQDSEHGQCRRNPPADNGWPETQPFDWCGEWRPYPPY